MHVWEASVSASFFANMPGRAERGAGGMHGAIIPPILQLETTAARGKYIANRNRASHFWKALPRARNCDGSLHGDQDVPFLHGHAITAAAHHG